MPGPFAVDASVFLNAFNPFEPGHEDSLLFLRHLHLQGVPLFAPTLLLPEVAAAVSRGRGDAALARRFAGELTRLPHLMLMPLDATLAAQAVEVASQHRLRGSDAVYAALAQRLGGTLVTLDREQHDRVSAILSVRCPADLCLELGLKPSP
jgi:predicted nucleic acid-binding protein